MRDAEAERLIAELVGLDDELAGRIHATETTAVTMSAAWSAAGTLEAVATSTDHDEVMMGQVRNLAQAVGKLRAVRKRRHQGLRRQIALYRQDLGYDPAESRARPPTVTTPTGRQRVAVQSVGPEGVREIETDEHESGPVTQT